jgi:hypothetical protein
MRWPAYDNPGAGWNNTSQGGANNVLNPTKRFNTWNVCSSCGWDVPKCHTSMTYPYECRKPVHMVNCDRENTAGMIAAGRNISQKGMHKPNSPKILVQVLNDG